jgi:hypothetical protein
MDISFIGQQRVPTPVPPANAQDQAVQMSELRWVGAVSFTSLPS